MPARPLLVFPDRRLLERAARVSAFDEALAALARDLLDTMRAAPGVGITACHVGVPLRLVVLELEPGKVATYVNPVLEAARGPLVAGREGSISMPGMVEDVERFTEVDVTYETLAGDEKTETATGFLSVCLQHEIDQLDGIFWIQRLSRLKRERLVKKWEKRGR